MIELEFFIPFYGRPDYLLASVNAIRALRDTHWRLTIVEDRYPDGPAVQRQIAALEDDRIHYHRNEANLGVNANIYQCIQLAEWDRFVIVDYDDLVAPNYGQAVADLISRHPDATIVQPDVQVIDEDGRAWLPMVDRVKKWIGPGGRTETTLAGESGAAQLLRGNWLYIPACCYRRDLLQTVPYRPGIDAAHDLAFIIDALLAGASIVTGTDVAFCYRRHRDSHSSSRARNGERFAEEQRYFHTVATELSSHGWTTAQRAANLMLFSRLNALTQMPAALASRDMQGAKPGSTDVGDW